MNNGWIALHRKLLDWEWWEDHNTTRLFLYLLLKANHEDKRWRGVEVKRGQLITGLHSLKKDTGISIRSLRTSLKRLESTNEVTRKTTSKYSVITVVKYSDYQDKDIKPTNKPTNKLTSKRQASDKQVTINNNDNNVTIKTNKQYKYFVDEFNKIVGSDHRGDSRSQSKFNQRIKKYTVEEMLKATRNAETNDYLMGRISKTNKKNTRRYLKPEYILREDKLDEWLNAKPQQSKNFASENIDGYNW